MNPLGFPDPLRGLVVGPSGSKAQKMEFITKLINNDWVNYSRVLIFAKSLDAGVYSGLKRSNTMIQLDNKEWVAAVSCCPRIIPFDELKEENVLVIFDDWMLKKKSDMIEYFMLGHLKRHHIVLLTQNYSKVPKTIRGCINYLLLFKQTIDIKTIWGDFFRYMPQQTFMEKYYDGTCYNLGCFSYINNLTENISK